ncbi:MAG: LolA-like outer membrane lipoprotein chaperone [Sulfurimonadaceae bacterium]
MRIIFVALFILSPLFAISEKTDTMKAEFIQTITDDKNSTITYKGSMLAKRPNMAMWHYKEPIEKTVFITAANVTIIEPELEQAIIKQLGNSIDILAILASAKRDSKNSYIAFYNNKEYHIAIQGDMIKAISYTDAFDNVVKIVFTAQQINKTINDSRFEADIPADFDIIKD